MPQKGKAGGDKKKSAKGKQSGGWAGPEQPAADAWPGDALERTLLLLDREGGLLAQCGLGDARPGPDAPAAPDILAALSRKTQGLPPAPGRYLLKLSLPDGGERLVEVFCGQTRLDGKEMFCLLASLAPPSDEDGAALRTSRATAAALINALTESVILLDPAGTIVAVNRAEAHRLGAEPQDLVGKPFWGFMPDDLALARKEQLASLAENQRPMKGEEYRNGRWMDTRLHPIMDDEGRLNRIAVMSVDVTERKLTAEALTARGEELTRQAQRLEELNTALKVLLEQRARDRRELERRVLENVEKLVLPALHKLAGSSLDAGQRTLLQAAQTRLQEISGGLGAKLGDRRWGLSPRELEVAALVVEGKTSQEIADILHLSKRTVDAYRLSLRKKVGIKGDRENLRAFLASLTQPS